LITPELRAQVQGLNGQITAANASLADLKQKLATAQQQLTSDQGHQGFMERLRGGSAQVQADNNTITALNGQIATAQANVTSLQQQIDSTVTGALSNDGDYKTRARQLTTLNKADAATKAFLGQIDQTKSAIKDAQSAQTANNVGDLAGAVFGTTNDPLQQAAHDAEVARKKAKLAVAGARVETLGAQTDAWKAQIEAITNEQVNATDGAALDPRMGTLLPLVSTFVSPTLAAGWDAFNDVSNAIALNKASTRVDSLRDSVQGYDDKVSSNKRQLETSQNNAFMDLRSRLLQ
jgi:chromosome segregation ATPase